eukprot:jgi/Botrbrau1/843/Bobra.0352s0037.1
MVPHGPMAFSSLASFRIHPAILSALKSSKANPHVGRLARAAVVIQGLASLSSFQPLWSLSPGIHGGPARKISTRIRGQTQGGGPLSIGGKKRRLTDILIGINMAVFVAEILTSDRITMLGAKVNSAINAGQWWRLVTPVFLHANLLHLVSNNYGLQNLGPPVEVLSGRKRFLAIYFISAVAGTLASYKMSPYPSVGASGAIFGLGGALAVYFQRNRSLFGKASDSVLQQLGQSLAVNVAMGLAVRKVDNWGHLGGLLGGALTAWLLGPRYVVEERKVGFKLEKVILDRPPLPIFASNPQA